MKIVKVLFLVALTTALTILLNRNIGDIPALGKLMNPFTGFWNNAENQSLHLPSKINSSNLKDSVAIYFDEYRIPHIFANNEYDLYFAQGYTVASLRLWQLEFQVLAAEGRLSEIIGDKALAFDMEQRRKGMVYGAQQKLAEIEADPLAQQLIHAYTDGVNNYIANLKKRDLPLEYKLIGYEPEPWSPYKTALLLMNMSNVLTNTEYDIENTNFIMQYGEAVFDTLFREWYPGLEPIYPTPDEGWPAHIDKVKAPDVTEEFEYDSTALALDPLAMKPSVQIGSNNWALSGSKTKSGYPLLANDPHLGLSFPSVWIEMHLSGPESNAYGVVFPGAPGIVIGFNDHIGWGVTNAGRDVKDWYTIEYKDHQKDYYKWGKGWRETTKVIEEYKVKGSASVFDTVVYTHLGPVYHENLSTQIGDVNLAVQWMAHRSGKEYMTFYLLNRAKNYDEYLEALTYYSCPAQNFVFASVDGDIALRQSGRFPVLQQEQGRTIQDGSMVEAWDEYIPFDEMPVQLNPSRGFVSSANQQVADTTYPYYYNGVFEYYRNRVINDELRGMHKADVPDMKQLQYNNFNLIAKESLPYLLGYLNSFVMDFDQQEVINSLKKWDLNNDKDSKAATYFQILFDSYYTSLWDELVEPEIANSWSNYYYKDGLIAPNEYQTIVLLRDSTKHQFIDNQETNKIETTQDIVTMAFEKAMDKIASLEHHEWGKYKSTQIQHLARIDAFSTTLDVGGGYKIVNATGSKHGPSWRMILDFSEGTIKGLGVYPGGQSGNPGSPFYDNMITDWIDGNHHELINANTRSTYENEKYQKVVLQP